MSYCARIASVRARTGIGDLTSGSADCTGRFIAFAIAAFITRAHVGLIPHAKHGGNGKSSSTVWGSKFEGTGFEKVQILHIHVPVLLGASSGLGRWKGLSARDGDAVALLEGPLRLDIPRIWTEDRLAGFGTRVILAEDFRKPACRVVRIHTFSQHVFETYIELVSVDILQINGCRVLSGVFVIDIADPVGCQIDLAILMVWDFVFPAGIFVRI
jgi:hypothetical protein